MVAGEKHDVPPGWDANPSSWAQRAPIIVLALIGFAIATYLALYQWGVANVWEPFFGDGSRVILHSSISHLLPIDDAALGAWLLLAPWVLSYDALQATVNSSATGILLAVSALLSGGPRGHYHGGWSSLWKQPRERAAG